MSGVREGRVHHYQSEHRCLIIPHKIGFNIKDKNINKEQIIQILTNLIDDIKNEKIISTSN